MKGILRLARAAAQAGIAAFSVPLRGVRVEELAVADILLIARSGVPLTPAAERLATEFELAAGLAAQARADALIP